MKKILFTIAIALFSFMNAKAQTMIIHGTTSTKFYCWENGQLYKLFADEMWVMDPLTERGVRGISASINLTYTAVPNYDPNDIPVATIVSCYEARKYNSGSCGPLDNHRDGSVTCRDANDTSCSIKLANGTIIYSPNGDF
ncbi:MAG: hypothetical protein PSX81_11885 [bacterium]|nr:hypothetical protein [bacterium]